MCGIFGFILNEPLQDKEIAEGLSHTKSLSHRGPDHLGSWFNKEEGIFLGHTRLSIIDLTSDSHQPFYNENSHLVFNGEIYNYRELKRSLISKGLAFRTEGDTEVLSNYLKEYGGDRLEEIDGMFAFAYYKEKSLILATDVFGEKPLYWYQNEKGFYFSSEPAPLISLLGLKLNPNKTLIKEFNTLGYLSAGKTFYEGLVSCEPGSFLEVKQNQKVNKRVYWKKPEFFEEKGRIHPLGESEIDEIHSLIIESLRNRIYSDVPMGLFLSSGIDSSLIGCLLKRELNLDVLSLTVSFDKGLVHDESDQAKRISKFLDLNHIIVDSESEDSYSSLHNLTSIYGEPNDNSTAISVRQMSKIAKNYFTVAFSGTGGDELFFGYGKHNFLYKNNYFLSNTFLKSFLNVFRSNQFKSFRKIQTAMFLSQYKGLDLVFALKKYAKKSKKKLSSFLEIGFATGVNNTFLNKLFNFKNLVSIDNIQPAGINANTFYANLRFKNLTLICGNSTDLNVINKTKKMGPYDFIFIDGGHEYDVVKKDFYNYSKALAKGGAIAFHDIKSNVVPGVPKFWNELKKKHKSSWQFFEFFDSGHRMECGIGLIIRK